MRQVNIHEAKTQLSKLIAETESGDEIIIAKAGKPIAKLVPYDQRSEPRRPGRLRHNLWVAEDFDETPLEVIDAFETSQ